MRVSFKKIIQSAFLVVLAHIKMIIAQNNMTKSLLVTSITGHNIAKNKARDSRSVAKVQTSFLVNWSKDPLKAQFWPADIPPTLCTHIIYAFADIPEGNNTIVPTEWNDISILYPAVMEIRSVFSKRSLQCSDWLKFEKSNREKNSELKVLLAVGGWNAGSEGFSSMVATKENRTEFIENAIEYLRDNGFDGLGRFSNLSFSDRLIGQKC